jgi:hypothetical protein
MILNHQSSSHKEMSLRCYCEAEENNEEKCVCECSKCGADANKVGYDDKVLNLFWDEEEENLFCVECATDQCIEIGKKGLDIVFNCGGCGIGIIRDSRAHDECITKDDIVWYCGDCAFEHMDTDDEEDEEEEQSYPCFRCEKVLYESDAMVGCGQNRDCETWYCVKCYEEGTDDCVVCKEDN